MNTLRNYLDKVHNKIFNKTSNRQVKMFKTSHIVIITQLHYVKYKSLNLIACCSIICFY